MADNTILSAAVGVGDTVRDFNDTGNVKWPAAAAAYVTGGSADAWTLQAVDAAHGLPVSGTVTANAGSGTFTVGGTVAVSNFPSGFLSAQSGTWTVGISAAQTIAVTNAGTFAVQATLGAGSQVIGHVIVDSGTVTTVSTVTAVTTVSTVTTVTTVGTVTTLTQWNAGHGTAAAALRVELPTDGTGVVGLNAGTALVGKVGIDQTTPGTTNAVADQPVTSGGLSVSSFLSTGAVQTAQIKGSAGQIYSIEFFNVGAAAVYVRLYNQTGAPASTDGANIIWRGMVPGNTAGAGFVKSWDKGIACGTGIGWRISGAVADNDATVLVANQIEGNITYK